MVDSATAVDSASDTSGASMAQLRDPARVADVRLQDVRRAFLQNLAEPPLGEDPLAGRDRDVRLPRHLRHHVDVQRLADLLIEPGMVRLERP